MSSDLSAPPRPALTAMPDTSERKLVAVAVLVGVLIICASLLRHDGDIAGLTKFGAGEHAAPLTAHVEELLDREVATVDLLGHDGSMFFLQAVDPFFLDPETHAVHFDRPVYRAQRMLFPTIAGLGGLLPPEAILWTMAALNTVALAMGTLGTARIAQRLGGSPWLGVGFLANPGIVFEFDISGAGIVAFSAAIWGTLALMDGRRRSAILWFTAAVLAREVMFLYLGGTLLYHWWHSKRFPFIYGAVPSVAALSWAVYIRTRLESHDGVDEIQEFGWPFGGMIDAFDNWVDDPVNLGVIFGLIAVMPLLVYRTIQRPNHIAAGALGFVLLAILMTRQVWWNFFDITRATAPVITAYVVTAFSEQRRSEGVDSSPS